MPHDLVHALSELRIGIRREPRTYALVRGLERFAAILAQIMSTGRDTDVHAIAVPNDRVHAEAAVARLPLARVLVIADARDHLPRITAVAASEQRRRLHAAP